MTCLRPPVVALPHPRRLVVLLLPIITMAVFAGAATTYGATQAQIDAARDTGLAWLVTHQRGDGSWRSQPGAEFATTATALEALANAGTGGYSYAAGVAWANNAPALSTDSLARKVVALSGAGMNVTPFVQALIQWRNDVSGWGAYDRFATTFPDTALALGAIRASQYSYSSTDIQNGLCLILTAQRTGAAAVYGSWSYVQVAGTAPSSSTTTTGTLLPTLQNILEVDAIRVAQGWTTVTCAGVPFTLATARDDAINWVLTQKKNADGGFGDDGASTVHETALAYLMLKGLRPSEPTTGAALDFLIARQTADGSWLGDALQTALVLKAFPSASLADTDKDGVPNTVETVLGTNPSVPDSRYLAAGSGNPVGAALSRSVNLNFGVALGAASAAPALAGGPSDGDLLLEATAARLADPGASGRPRVYPGSKNVPLATEAFQTDLYTGAATAQIPIVVPSGAGGVAPQLVLRYDGRSVDDLGAQQQGPSAGLGWTLDAAGTIVRDTKNTATTTDDTFQLVWGGQKYDLVLVDTGQQIYHTKDETFWKLQYTSAGDSWTLTTKDGTKYRLGYNTDSKQKGLNPDNITPVTWKYWMDEVGTTSGTGIRYAYTKVAATVTSTGGSYDRAIYLDTITYAYSGGAAVGGLRQVTVTRTARTDWTNTSTSTTMAFFDQERIDTIEVRVGGSLVRKYVLGFDYSIDRDPTYTWGGGAAGDLTLTTVALYGADGVSALPPLTFAYASGRLSSAGNGIGGTVTYAYEQVQTSPLYSVCSTQTCGDRGVCMDADPWGQSTLVGYTLPAAVPTMTVPVYSYCHAAAPYPYTGCGQWGIATSPGSTGLSTQIGNLYTAPVQGTVPIYAGCLTAQGSTCLDWGVKTTADSFSGPTPLGYVYVAAVNRYRVTTWTQNDGRGGAVTVTYSYNGLGLSADGKDFRGHASARMTDAAGTYTTTWFYQDDTGQGRVYQAETRNSGNALLRQTVHAWTPSTPYTGVTFVALTRTDTYDCGATCRQTAQTFEYDAYGNQSRVYDWGDVAVTGDERDETIDWVVDANAWIHRPTRTALYDVGSVLRRERWLSYDGLGWGALGARGLVSSDEARLAGSQGTSGNAVTAYAYDGYGNRTSVTGSLGCVRTTVYDSSQTFPATVTACLDHTTTYVYDARWGEPTSVTDPNAQTTTLDYDTFGRLTKATGSLDTGSTYGTFTRQYLDWGTAGLQRILTYRTEQHGTANYRWSDEYFDGLGRAYLTRAEGPGGQTIQSESAFNSRGLVASTSVPRFAAESQTLTQFGYDGLGRRTQVTHPGGATATAAYAPGLVTLTDERGTVRLLYRDAYDRLTRVDEGNGAQTASTHYQYDAAGSLTRVTNHLGQTTTMTYDPVGRRLSVQGNGPAWTFTYDRAGNVLTQTDPKGQTITFTYDTQGRRLTKQYPDPAQIAWTWDDPAVLYSKGRVTRIADAVSITTFTYDKLGRPIQIARLLDSTTYTLTRSYDALQRITSQTFPDNETVTYTHNEAGWLAAVPGYITSLAYNARGQRTQLQYASGVTTTWTYDPNHFRVLTQVTSGPGGPLQNFTYTYDGAGTVAQISDAVGTGARSVTYDGLGRVTTVSGTFGPLVGSVPSAVATSYRYDGAGNLLERAGTLYAYSDPFHPAAVTATSSGGQYSYDAAGNMLTGADRTLTWDADNRIAEIATGGNNVRFAYDSAGHVVRRSTGATVTVAPFPGYEVTGGVTSKFLGFATTKSTGEKFFYHADHLGAANVITDTAGTLTHRIEFDPWGVLSRFEGSEDAALRLNTLSLDPEPAVARPYDPALGRHLTPMLVPATSGDPQRLNEYAFRENNGMNLPAEVGFGARRESHWRSLFQSAFGATAR